MNSGFILKIGLLMLATIAVSSAAIFFDEIEGVSGSMKACWRLQSCSMIQIFFAAWEYRSNPNKTKRFYRENWWLICIAAFCLAGNFSLWATSLVETSLVHSLVFVCCTPVLAMIIQFFSKTKPNFLQIIGVFISFGGLLVLTLTVSSDKDASLFGDALAFMASVCVLIYLHCGKHAGKSEVLWVYVFPVNFFANFIAFIFAITVQQDNGSRIVEWMYTSHFLPVIALGIVPGNIGHTSLNYLVKTLSPLVVTAFVNFEPLIGGFMGWIAGYQDPPTIWTWLGGSLLIVGNTAVTIGEKKAVTKEDEEDKNIEISMKLTTD